MSTRQLRLVTDGEEEGGRSTKPNAGPAERLFAHWVWMMGKSARRTALGPSRRKVLVAALELYDEGTLALAIDGCAGSAWHAGENDRGQEFNDLTLILRDEAHVERFAEMGERMRRELGLQQAADARDADAAPDLVSQAEAEAARKALRAFALKRSGRAA